MKIKKKYINIMCIIMVCVMLVVSMGAYSEKVVYANEQPSIPNEIEDYEGQVAMIMVDYSENPDLAIMKLEELDTVIVSEPMLVPTIRGTLPSQYELSVYAFKRGNSDNYYLQWKLEVNSKEYRPGPLDFVSLEWEATRGSYYSSSGDSTRIDGDSVTMVSSRKTGIVMFNVEDESMNSGDYTYGTVIITPTEAGWLEFGSKYVHTYTLSDVSGSASFAFKPAVELSTSGEASLNVSGNYGFTVNVDNYTEEWSLWEDNAVDISSSHVN